MLMSAGIIWMYDDLSTRQEVGPLPLRPCQGILSAGSQKLLRIIQNYPCKLRRDPNLSLGDFASILNIFF